MYTRSLNDLRVALLEDGNLNQPQQQPTPGTDQQRATAHQLQPPVPGDNPARVAASAAAPSAMIAVAQMLSGVGALASSCNENSRTYK